MWVWWLWVQLVLELIELVINPVKPGPNGERYEAEGAGTADQGSHPSQVCAHGVWTRVAVSWGLVCVVLLHSERTKLPDWKTYGDKLRTTLEEFKVGRYCVVVSCAHSNALPHPLPLRLPLTIKSTVSNKAQSMPI